MQQIRLTQFSHGAGCGCKIAPGVLEEILRDRQSRSGEGNLLVGNQASDDAAVLDIGGGRALISTTDFFMPIVDDPLQFGRIAAANAISDVYAMGGSPILAIAILGWPIDRLPASVAGTVLEGGRMACAEAGIPLAGGHSIDAPEPIFGLAVNGLVELEHLKPNDRAREGDLLLLTKPLGVGILTTAEKRGSLRPEHAGLAGAQMAILNRVGEALGRVRGVHAMTDVTGFGLLGHLSEMCGGSGLSATLLADRIPLIAPLAEYIAQGCIPGGTGRNWHSYGHHVSVLTERDRSVLCDPQTSGGLLIAVGESELGAVQDTLRSHGLADHTGPIGRLDSPRDGQPRISVSGSLPLEVDTRRTVA